jgi:hypothetical protein
MRRNRFFIIRLPNGKELLFSEAFGWSSMTAVITYFDRAYDSDTVIYPVSWFKAVKFLFKRRYRKR